MADWYGGYRGMSTEEAAIQIAHDLTNLHSKQTVFRSLCRSGWDPYEAATLVEAVSSQVNKEIWKGHRNSMISYGAIALVFVSMSIASYLYAVNVGGRYLITWGAIAVALFCCIKSLFEWLHYKKVSGEILDLSSFKKE